MHIVARKVNNTPGKLLPVLVDVPVVHHGRRIGTAEVTGQGQITIEIDDPFDQNGIFQVLSTLRYDVLTLGMSLGEDDG